MLKSENDGQNWVSFVFRTAALFWRLLRCDTQPCSLARARACSLNMAPQCLHSYTHLNDEVYYKDTAKFTQAFHTCILKDTAGIICIFHDTCNSQNRLLLFLFGERALQHLNFLLQFSCITETMVCSGHRWTRSNKVGQSLVEKKDWHGPEDTDDLGHALWLLLSRKSKTIPSEECLHSTEQTPLLFI